MALMSMKIYVQQIRRFISIDGYYTHFLIFRINLGYIENVNIANGSSSKCMNEGIEGLASGGTKVIRTCALLWVHNAH